MMEARELWRQVRSLDAPISLKLGPNTADRYIHDPRRIGFFMARYKFAAKMLHACTSIADIGCGDGFGSLMFCNNANAKTVHGYDFDEQLIDYAQTELSQAVVARSKGPTPQFFHADFLKAPLGQTYDGLCSLDVIEHVEPERSLDFISRVYDTLAPCGVAVIGTPNEYAAQFGSPHSQLGHINNFTPERLRAEMEMHFPCVFLFSANDEMVHVGFDKLAHYLIAVGVKPGFAYRRPA